MEKIDLLLPMKGHSERVPNKNLKNFAGAPLYHAILKKINDSRRINKIYVNTDSEEIRVDVKKNFERVVIIDRPDSLLGDNVSMNRIIEHDLSKIDGEHFIQTHSTNPLLNTATIDNAINLYFRNIENYDSMFSVTKLQTRLYKANGEPLNHNPDELKRTQELPPVYEENSNFYIFSKESFQKSGSRRIGLNPYLFSTGQLESIDIDEPDDFKLAELLYQNF